ncbi:hypothetical protein T484DRAFT_1920027 [Baffinella frigidus]|nr:hypothetical protein T484DRAFT_1920027 [Cryptophyta sp. CCMP2293]
MSCGFRCRGQVGRGTGMGALLLALVAMCGVDTTAHGPLHPVPVWDDRAAPLGRFRCSAAFLRPATPTHFGALAGRKGDAHLCRTREACFPGTGGPGPAATAIFRGGNAPLRADALWALTAARGATSGAAGGRGGASPPGEGGRDRDVAGEELAGARGGGAAIKGRRGAPPDTARRLLQELGLNETQLEAVCRKRP